MRFNRKNFQHITQVKLTEYHHIVIIVVHDQYFSLNLQVLSESFLNKKGVKYFCISFIKKIRIKKYIQNWDHKKKTFHHIERTLLHIHLNLNQKQIFNNHIHSYNTIISVLSIN